MEDSPNPWGRRPIAGRVGNVVSLQESANRLTSQGTNLVPGAFACNYFPVKTVESSHIYPCTSTRHSWQVIELEAEEADQVAPTTNDLGIDVSIVTAAGAVSGKRI